MIDPADEGITLPLPVTLPCTHTLKYASEDSTIYSAHLTQDLFGDWVILRSWGQSKRSVANVEEGIAVLAALATQLRKRGCMPFAPSAAAAP